MKGTGRWEPVDLLKSATGIEGSPAGWHRIEGLRICAWRGGDRNAVFDIALPEHLNAIVAKVGDVKNFGLCIVGDALGLRKVPIGRSRTPQNLYRVPPFVQPLHTMIMRIHHK